MSPPTPQSVVRRAPKRRGRPVRAVAAALVLCLATVAGASIAIGRAPVPINSVDPLLLTRVVPEPVPATAPAVPAPSRPPDPVDAVADFAAPELSLEPRPDPELTQAVGVIVKPTPTPKPKAASHRVSGVSSWYCLPGVSDCHYAYSGGFYAAAGPALRVGSWRGRTVHVCSGGRCVNVKLIDWCQCYGSRVIDLYSDAFRRLSPLSEGTIPVTVTW